ncbi:sulfotransferase family 2 domain-containing protein [Mesorhizobium sp. BHbsci]
MAVPLSFIAVKVARRLSEGGAMLSRELGCLFIHIPKNGGTSIEDAIWPDRKARSADQYWKNAELNRHQKEGLHHLTAAQIRSETGAETFDRMFKFSLVRNPWDKAVSQFLYTKTWRQDLRRILGLTRFMSFRSYLRAIQLVDHPQWRPQHLFVDDQDGNLLVDYVGRFERIREEFSLVSERIGLANVALPHSKKAIRKADYHDYYTPETRDMIWNIYRTDIERFEYNF